MIGKGRTKPRTPKTMLLRRSFRKLGEGGGECLQDKRGAFIENRGKFLHAHQTTWLLIPEAKARSRHRPMSGACCFNKKLAILLCHYRKQSRSKGKLKCKGHGQPAAHTIPALEEDWSVPLEGAYALQRRPNVLSSTNLSLFPKTDLWLYSQSRAA